MKIIVDADACPRKVLQICGQVAEKYDIALYTVASFNHNIKSTHHTVVGDSSQETDIALVNMTAAGDIVITQDWGLASLALGKGAGAISPGGRIYRPETIDFLLEEREIKARLRRKGARTRGPRKRSPDDDERFGAALHRLIEEIRSFMR